MPTVPEDACLSGKPRSDGSAFRMTRLIRFGSWTRSSTEADCVPFLTRHQVVTCYDLELQKASSSQGAHAAAQIHHTCGYRPCGVAARCSCAAAGDTGGWFWQFRFAARLRATPVCHSQKAERGRVH